MPESPAIQILRTTVKDGGAYVEMVLANAPSLEDASESVALSVRVDLKTKFPELANYQRHALHRAVELIREITRPLDSELS